MSDERLHACVDGALADAERTEVEAYLAGGILLDAVLHTTWGGRHTGAESAALAHAADVPEVRHPIEVLADDEQHQVAWLSKRLDAPVRAPSLLSAGYRLLGGRLLSPAGAVGTAPVALFMCESAQGGRLSLLVRRESTSSGTAFRFAPQGATNVFHWVDGPLG